MSSRGALLVQVTQSTFFELLLFETTPSVATSCEGSLASL
jgi:hypothetical protein